MMSFYLMIIGIVLVSLILSLVVAYLSYKLLTLLCERYVLFIRDKSKYARGNKGNKADNSVNIHIFTKSLYHITHLLNIWGIIRYAFGKLNVNSAINKGYEKEKENSENKNTKRNPEPRFHADTLPQEKGGKQPNANSTGFFPFA